MCDVISNDLGVFINEVFDDVERRVVLAVPHIGKQPAITLELVLILVRSFFKVSDRFFWGVESGNRESDL